MEYGLLNFSQQPNMAQMNNMGFQEQWPSYQHLLQTISHQNLELQRLKRDNEELRTLIANP